VPLNPSKPKMLILQVATVNGPGPPPVSICKINILGGGRREQRRDEGGGPVPFKLGVKAITNFKVPSKCFRTVFMFSPIHQLLSRGV